MRRTFFSGNYLRDSEPGRNLFVLLEKVEEVPARTILEDDPEMVAGLVPVIELEHVGVVQVVEYLHLRQISRNRTPR